MKTKESNKKVALVTGASSGIGYAVCGRLLADGYTVYGLSRRGTAPDGVKGISADVTDSDALERAAATIAEREGQLDLLVAAAGFGISGPVEFTSDEQAAKQMNVNFLGQFYAMRAVLPIMRRQQSGTIVSVSSVAGIMSIPYQSFYSASKAAVDSLILSLRNEVKSFGIRVTAVLPGDTATGFTDAREKDDSGNDVYQKTESAVRSMEKDERGGMTPDAVAKVIVSAAKKRNPAPLCIAGGKYKLFNFLFRILPTRAAYAIIGMMYS